MSVAEAFQKYCDLDLGRGIDDPAWFRQEVEARGVTLTEKDTWDDAFFKILLRDIEPKLGQGVEAMGEGSEGDSTKRLNERSSIVSPALLGESPSSPTSGTALRPVILYDYPRSMAALARLKESDPRYAERFEAYVAGIELCNAYSELGDPVEQRARQEDELAERRAAGRADYGLDEQFLEAVGQMPRSAGIAFGVDRLVLLLADAATLREILYFPSADLFG
jgi:elongation factor P--beta-lysine ligase